MKKESSVGIGKPTKREAEILHYAREYRRENGYSPSMVEIAKYFDISVPTVHQHIYSLKDKNLLGVE
jgi:DNA-binding MarR family transcriptional regulator